MSSAASSADAGRGAVYDRGYRPYDGPRGRRGAATLALYKASMRRALGLRRPWRQKVAPFVLLGVVTIPATRDPDPSSPGASSNSTTAIVR